jgi:Tfp pilus assembly protein PilF
VKIRPDFADGHHNLGVTYLTAGSVDRAIEHLRRALELQPDAINAHRNLARAYELKGLPDEARAHTRRAQALSR